MSEAITASDLDELEDSPAAVAGPIDPEVAGDAPAPEADAELAESDDLAESDAIVLPEDPVLECQDRLAEACKRESKARQKYEAAVAEVSAINQELAGLLQKASETPLHILNAMQDRITRPEQARTVAARHALDALQAHFRPGKRQYPVHPSVRSAVKGEE